MFYRTHSEEALTQAKRNVAQYYAVIGLNENLEEFFEVLEWMFPKHFGGALNVYKLTSKFPNLMK